MPRDSDNHGGEHEGEGPGGRRVDPPGQEDNAHSQRPDTPPGLLGDQTLVGTEFGDELRGARGDDSLVGLAGDDRLRGQSGDDTLDGGAGDDTLAGGPGADLLVGGAGNDLFHVSGPARSLTGLDHIADFTHGADHIAFGDDLTLDAASFATGTATDFEAALALARTQLADGSVHVLAVQVGGDVIVFAGQDEAGEDDADGDKDDAGGVGSAVVLVGHSLADVSVSDFS